MLPTKLLGHCGHRLASAMSLNSLIPKLVIASLAKNRLLVLCQFKAILVEVATNEYGGRVSFGVVDRLNKGLVLCAGVVHVLSAGWLACLVGAKCA